MSRIGNYTIHESCKSLRAGKRIILLFPINDFVFDNHFIVFNKQF